MPKFGIILILSLAFFPQSTLAQEKTPIGIYQIKKVKSRASRGFNAHGTIIYQYTRVDKRAKPKDAAVVGNIDVGKRAHVRNIYNRTIVDRSVRATGQAISMGEISINGASNLDTVDNRTFVRGSLRSTSGYVGAGNVKVKGNAHIKNLQNTVKIKGKINVR